MVILKAKNAGVDFLVINTCMCVTCIYRGDVVCSTPAPSFMGDCRQLDTGLSLVRLQSWLDEKSTLSGLAPVGRKFVHQLVKWNVLKGKKNFQPSLVFIDSGKQERWHMHQTQPRGSFVDLNVRTHSFLHFAPSICCSLFLCFTEITGLFGLSHTRQTWMRCFFPLIKVLPLK